MFNKLLLEIKNMNNPIKNTMFIGFKISFVICLFAIFILTLYITYPLYFIAYDIGLILLKNSLLFAISFFVSAYVTNGILS